MGIDGTRCCAQIPTARINAGFTPTVMPGLEIFAIIRRLGWQGRRIARCFQYYLRIDVCSYHSKAEIRTEVSSKLTLRSICHTLNCILGFLKAEEPYK